MFDNFFTGLLTVLTFIREILEIAGILVLYVAVKNNVSNMTLDMQALNFRHQEAELRLQTLEQSNTSNLNGEFELRKLRNLLKQNNSSPAPTPEPLPEKPDATKPEPEVLKPAPKEPDNDAPDVKKGLTIGPVTIDGVAGEKVEANKIKLIKKDKPKEYPNAAIYSNGMTPDDLKKVMEFAVMKGEKYNGPTDLANTLLSAMEELKEGGYPKRQVCSVLADVLGFDSILTVKMHLNNPTKKSPKQSMKRLAQWLEVELN